MLCRSTRESERLILEYVENTRNWKAFLISWYFDKTEGIDLLAPSAKRLSVSWEKAQDSLGWNSREKRLGSGSGTSRVPAGLRAAHGAPDPRAADRPSRPGGLRLAVLKKHI